MSDELNSKFLQLSFRDLKTDADLGDGISVKSDLQAVKDAFTSAIGVVGIQKCTKIGGTAVVIATATFVAAKSLAVKWSWLKTTDVEEKNVLKVAFPPSREETFKKILNNGQLERVVQDNFADLESNLEGILGIDVYEEVGKQVLELIQDVRVSSVREFKKTAENPNNMVAMNVVDGERDVNERNVNKLVAADGKGKGMVAMDYVRKGGKITGTVTGGSYAVICGDSSVVKEAAAAHAKMNDEKVLVTVRFPEDYSPEFKQSFQPTDKIFDIRSALKEERQKLYCLVREAKPWEILPNSLRVVDIKDDLYGYENEETVHKQYSPLVPATVQVLPFAPHSHVVNLSANVSSAASLISSPAAAQFNIEQVTSDVKIVQVKPSDEVAYRDHLTKDTIYHIKPDKQKGRVLIINNEFRGQGKSERRGSAVDFGNMNELWQKLGFEVVSSSNQTAQEILQSCKKFSNETRNTSVLVVIIMSHGGMNQDGKEFFCGEDNNQILLKDIIEEFTTSKYPHLKGVPKVFMFQACRGDEKEVQPDNVLEADSYVRLPVERDMLLAFPTKRGFISLRDTVSGSWMMNAVTNVFMQHAHDNHVLEMLTMVNNAVAKKEAQGSGLVQASNQGSYLLKNLFLFPGWP